MSAKDFPSDSSHRRLDFPQGVNKSEVVDRSSSLTSPSPNPLLVEMSRRESAMMRAARSDPDSISNSDLRRYAQFQLSCCAALLASVPFEMDVVPTSKVEWHQSQLSARSRQENSERGILCRVIESVLSPVLDLEEDSSFPCELVGDYRGGGCFCGCCSGDEVERVPARRRRRRRKNKNKTKPKENSDDPFDLSSINGVGKNFRVDDLNFQARDPSVLVDVSSNDPPTKASLPSLALFSEPLLEPRLDSERDASSGQCSPPKPLILRGLRALISAKHKPSIRLDLDEDL